MSRLWIAPLALAGALFFAAPGQAQTPRDIQNLIAAGQESQAIQDLNQVLAQHPDSGIAWYLLAEARDAQGNEPAAAQALAKAQQIAPTLPFANPNEVASLQAHLAAPHMRTSGGAHPAILIIGGLVLAFLLLRLFAGRRQSYVQPGYNAPGAQPFGYGNPGYGPMGGGGGGLGSSILGGLAAGAGFAAGERIIDGMMGGNQGQNFGGDPFGNTQQGPDTGRDDGLSGDPGWDNSGGGGGLSDDSNNSWS